MALPTIWDTVNDGVALPAHSGLRDCTRAGQLQFLYYYGATATWLPGNTMVKVTGNKALAGDPNPELWLRGCVGGSLASLPIQPGLFWRVSVRIGAEPLQLRFGFTNAAGASPSNGPGQVTMVQDDRYGRIYLTTGDDAVIVLAIDSQYNWIEVPAGLNPGIQPLEFTGILREQLHGRTWLFELWARGTMFENGALTEEWKCLHRFPFANFGDGTELAPGTTRFQFDAKTNNGVGSPWPQYCYLQEVAFGVLDAANSPWFDPAYTARHRLLAYGTSPQFTIDPAAGKPYRGSNGVGAGGAAFDPATQTAYVLGNNGTGEAGNNTYLQLLKSASPFRSASECLFGGNHLLETTSAPGLALKYTGAGNPATLKVESLNTAGHVGNTLVTLTLNGIAGSPWTLELSQQTGVASPMTGEYVRLDPAGGTANNSLRAWIESHDPGNWTNATLGEPNADATWLSVCAATSIREAAAAPFTVNRPVWNEALARRDNVLLAACARWITCTPHSSYVAIRTVQLPGETASAEATITHADVLPWVPMHAIWAPVNRKWFIAMYGGLAFLQCRLLTATAANPSQASDWTIGPIMTVGGDPNYLWGEEPYIAELPDGTLFMSWRNPDGKEAITSYSTDGGATWAAKRLLDGNSAGCTWVPAVWNPVGCFTNAGYLYLLGQGRSTANGERKDLCLWKSTTKPTAATIGSVEFVPDRRTIGRYGASYTYAFPYAHGSGLYVGTGMAGHIATTLFADPHFFAAEAPAGGGGMLRSMR